MDGSMDGCGGYSGRVRNRFQSAALAVAFLVLATAGTAGVSGCSSWQDVPEPHVTLTSADSQESAPDNEEETAETAGAEVPGAQAPEAETPPEPVIPQPPACDTAPDPRAAQYPVGATGIVPTVRTHFSYNVVENTYDACAPISYIAFGGRYSDANGGGSTGSSFTDAVMFFTNGTHHATVTFPRYDGITVNGDSMELRASAWDPMTGSADRRYIPHTVTFQERGGDLVPTGGDVQWFLSRVPEGVDYPLF